MRRNRPRARAPSPRPARGWQPRPRRDDGEDRVLLDEETIGVRERERAAAAALPDADGHARRRQPVHGREGHGDLAGDAVGLRVGPGIGARDVDEREQRQPEATGEGDGAAGQAVARGLVPAVPRSAHGPAVGGDHDDASTGDGRQAGLQCGVGAAQVDPGRAQQVGPLPPGEAMSCPRPLHLAPRAAGGLRVGDDGRGRSRRRPPSMPSTTSIQAASSSSRTSASTRPCAVRGLGGVRAFGQSLARGELDDAGPGEPDDGAGACGRDIDERRVRQRARLPSSDRGGRPATGAPPPSARAPRPAVRAIWMSDTIPSCMPRSARRAQHDHRQTFLDRTPVRPHDLLAVRRAHRAAEHLEAALDERVVPRATGDDRFLGRRRVARPTQRVAAREVVVPRRLDGVRGHPPSIATS